MAKYSGGAGRKVEKVMHEFKEGKLKSGSGDKVKSRKQAIAIGLSEAREEGEKVPPKTGRKQAAGKRVSKKSATSRKSAAKKSTSRNTTARKTAVRKTSSRKTAAKKSASKKTTAKRTKGSD